MTDKQLYKAFKQDLGSKGISIKWWIKTNLPKIKYNAAMAQLNGFNQLSDYVRKSITKYLGE